MVLALLEARRHVFIIVVAVIMMAMVVGARRQQPDIHQLELQGCEPVRVAAAFAKGKKADASPQDKAAGQEEEEKELLGLKRQNQAVSRAFGLHLCP